MAAAGSMGPVVLAVEDEPLILWVALDIISGAGFDAVGAKNADEAIAILELRDDIGVVFTDISMPGSMDGLKFAHAVRDRWPPIKIIVSSALGLGDERALPEGGKFIPKPYAPATISKTLTGSFRTDVMTGRRAPPV